MPKLTHVVALAFILLAGLANTALAEKSKDIGDFVVHYNALTTDFLSPETARAYDIQRSANRAMVTISVLKRNMGVPNKPVKAEIEIRATNLNQQVKPMQVREIVDQGAIYYIAEFKITDGETVDFNVEVVPEGGPRGTVTFRQQFFAD
jgi:hypothetical protein